MWSPRKVPRRKANSGTQQDNRSLFPGSLGSRPNGPLCDVPEGRASSGIFPALAYDLCAAGEEAGALDRVFTKLGDYCEQKLQDEAQTLAKVVQPVIIILLACIVGFIVIAFFRMWSQALIQLQGQVVTI